MQRAASASWCSMLAPSGVHSSGEALAAVNAMFEFPLAQDSPTYDGWRARINALLEYARKCPEPARACSQSHHGPVHPAVGPAAGPANNPVPAGKAPAPQAPAQPVAKEPEHVSVGSFTSHPPADAREIINDRQAEDACIHVKCNCH
jgi:hypothetical protein